MRSGPRKNPLMVEVYALSAILEVFNLPPTHFFGPREQQKTSINKLPTYILDICSNGVILY